MFTAIKKKHSLSVIDVMTIKMINSYNSKVGIMVRIEDSNSGTSAHEGKWAMSLIWHAEGIWLDRESYVRNMVGELPSYIGTMAGNQMLPFLGAEAIFQQQTICSIVK